MYKTPQFPIFQSQILNVSNFNLSKNKVDSIFNLVTYLLNVKNCLILRYKSQKSTNVRGQ